jgi:hypothetical protein
MITYDEPPESELYNALVKDKTLPHPTSRGFDRSKWQDAYHSLVAPSPRDEALAVAAIHYGTELRSLRNTFDDKIFKGMNRREAKIFSIAFANREFFFLSKKVVEKIESKPRGRVARLDNAGVLVSNAQSGEKLSPDSMTATIVDTLPHCIERAQRLAERTSNTEIKLDDDHFKLYAVLSIEHSIRDLWQDVVWRGAAITLQNGQLKQVPANKSLAEHELAWSRRNEGIALQHAIFDMITERQLRKHGAIAQSYLSKTIVGVGTGHGGRAFRFGPQSGAAGRQWRHRGQATALEDSYLSDFLDVPLPSTEKHALTCRELHRVWCLLADAASILESKRKAKDLSDYDSTKQFALLMRKSEYERAIIECLGLSAERASEAMRFLTLDGSDAASMFDDGFWSCPVLAVDENEAALLVPSLFVGNTIRTAEHWLARGGLTDNLLDARRGRTFEAHVRNALTEAVKKNALFSDSVCCPDELKGEPPNGEQVDLLFRVRDLVVVGEVKCLLAPIEPTEYANYLRKIKEACIQAARKAEWLNKNRDLLVKLLKLSAERSHSAKIIPIVVINQSVGSSLVSDGVHVIDFHFLKLYLDAGEYSSGAAFSRDEVDTVVHHETLYKNEEEAKERFLASIENPKPLKKYLDLAAWTETRFPMSNGDTLLIENCIMEGNLTSMADEEIEKLFA